MSKSGGEEAPVRPCDGRSTNRPRPHHLRQPSLIPIPQTLAFPSGSAERRSVGQIHESHFHQEGWHGWVKHWLAHGLMGLAYKESYCGWNHDRNSNAIEISNQGVWKQELIGKWTNHTPSSPSADIGRSVTEGWHGWATNWKGCSLQRHKTNSASHHCRRAAISSGMAYPPAHVMTSRGTLHAFGRSVA